MTILKHTSLIPMHDELRGFSRTIAEIEWLIFIVVLAFQFIRPLAHEDRTAIMLAVILFGGFTVAFRYANVCKAETRWKLAIETLAMILFVSWVIWHSGKTRQPSHESLLITDHRECPGAGRARYDSGARGSHRLLPILQHCR